jgi:ribosomal protein S1
MKCNGKIVHKAEYGYLIELENGLNGLLHINFVPKRVEFDLNQTINVSINRVNFQKQQISLKL